MGFNSGFKGLNYPLRPNKNWMEGVRKAMNERDLSEGQWEDRKQWSLCVGKGRKAF